MQNQKEKLQNDPVTGVFIFSKEMKNDGKIISEGKRPVTHIQTEQYSGKGLVQSKQTVTVKERLYEKWWVQLIFVVVGGLIVAYFSFKFGWTK